MNSVERLSLSTSSRVLPSTFPLELVNILYGFSYIAFSSLRLNVSTDVDCIFLFSIVTSANVYICIRTWIHSCCFCVYKVRFFLKSKFQCLQMELFRSSVQLFVLPVPDLFIPLQHCFDVGVDICLLFTLFNYFRNTILV